MSDKSLLVQLAAERKKYALSQASTPVASSDPVQNILERRARDRQWELEQRAQAARSGDELAQDGTLSMARFANQVASGLPALGMKALAETADTPLDTDNVPLTSSALVGDVVGLGLKATGLDRVLDERANRLLAGSAERDASLYSRMTNIGQAEEAVAGQRGAQLEAENLATQERRIEEGMHPGLAKSLRFGADIVDSAGNVIDHPGYLFNQAVGQAPTLLLGPAGRGVSAIGAPGRAHLAAQMAQTPAREAVRRAGMGAAAGRAESRAAGELYDKMTARTQRNAVAAGGLGMETSAMYAEGASEILNTPLEALAEKYPGVREQIEAGDTESQIKDRLINEVVLPAVGAMAPITYGLMRASTGLELNPMARPAASGAASARAELAADRLRTLATNTAGEIMEEAGQGAGSTLLGNVFEARRSGEEDADLLAGVGRAVGESIPISGAFSAALGAPGVAADAAGLATQLGAEAVVGTARVAGDIMTDRSEAVREKLAEGATEEQRKAVSAQIDAAVALSKMMPDLPVAAPLETSSEAGTDDNATNTSASTNTVPVPEGLDAPLEEGTSANRLTAYAQAVTELMTTPDLDPARRTSLQLFIARTARDAQAQVKQVLEPALEAATDPAEQERLTTAIDHLSAFTESEQIQQIQQAFEAMPQDQVDAAFNALPENLSQETALLPATQEALALIDELVLRAPEKVTVEQADRVLAARSYLKPDQRARLEAAREFAQSRIPHAEALARAESVSTKKGKTPSIVVDQVANTGFQEEGSKLKSLKQHFSEIGTAMSEGRVEDARKQFTRLVRWGEHAQARAKAGQDQALRQLELGQDEFVETRYRATDENGQLSNKKLKLNPFQINSAALVEVMGAEANVIADTAQALAKAYPELGGVNLPRIERVDFIGLSQARNAEGARADRLKRAVADAQARGKNSQVFLDEDGRVQLRDVDDMHPNQKATSVLRADGKPMTARQLERLLSGQDVSDLAQVAAPAPTPNQAPAVEETPAEAPNQEAGDAQTPEQVAEPAVTEDTLVEQDEQAEQPEQVEQAVAEEAVAEEDAADPAPVSEPRSLSERFQGVIASIGDLANATKAQVLAQTNRLLYAFQPDERQPGLFDRVPGGIPQLVDAIDNGTLAELLPERYKHLAAKGEDLAPLREFLTEHVAMVADAMDRHLQQVLNQRVAKTGPNAGKTLLQALRDGTLPQRWNDAHGVFLHAVQLNENGSAQFNPEVTKAAALAALNWTLETYNRPIKPDWDKIGKVWNRGMSPALSQAYRTGHFLDEGPRTIARDIQRLLGLRARTDLPANLSQELMNSLALLAVEALQAQDYVTIDTVVVPGKYTYSGKDTPVHFARFADHQRWDQEGARPPHKALLAALIKPHDEGVPVLGQAPKATATRVKGNAQLLSDEQRQVEQVHNDQAFYLNPRLLELIKKVGWDVFRRLRGYNDADLSRYNEVHRAGVLGLNQSIEYQDKHLTELVEQLRQYAATQGTEVDQIPVYWHHRTVSNGRVMAQGVSPQRDKLFRELLTLPKSAITKGAEGTEDRLFAAVAQALGLAKLEKVGIEAAAESVREVLDAPELLAVLQALDAPGPDFLDLVQALKPLGIAVDNTKALHALQTLNDYLVAEDGAEFAYNLTIEIDGVNNGPHNAHLQFLSGQLSPEDLRQMAQGGVYLGAGRPVTLADQDSSIGDRYTDTSHAATEISKKRIDSKDTHPAVRALYKPLSALMAKASLATLDEDGKLKELTRAFGKAVLVPVGYMSGRSSVANKLADALMDGFYEEISRAIAEDRPVDPEMVAQMHEALSEKVRQRPDDVEVSSGPGLRLPTTKKELIGFRFSFDQIRTLRTNVASSIGADAFDAAEGNIYDARMALSQVVDASKMLAGISDFLFDEAYEARRQELVAAGEINARDALPEEEVRKVLDGLKATLPNLALAHTDEDSADQGLSAVVKDKGRPLTLVTSQNHGAPTRLGVRTPLTGLRLVSQRSGIGNPGVSLAPALVIGSGDVSMVHKLKMRAKQLPNFLQIWDGLDVHPEHAGRLGEAANQAAMETWDYTALNTVNDALDRFDDQLLESLTKRQALMILEKAYPDWALDQMLEETPDPKELLSERMESLKANLALSATMRETQWTAMKELGVSVDQMAGGGTPYVHPGSGQAMSTEEIVTAVNTRAAELRDRMVERNAPRANRENALVSELTEGQDLRRYGKDEVVALLQRPGLLSGKIAPFVLKTLAPLLPDNLVVTLGTPEALAAVDGRMVGNRGLYVAGKTPQVFVADFSPVTLLHELVHAATSGMITDYYGDRRQRLSDRQQDAIRQLEKLAEAFLRLEPEHPDRHARMRLEHAQQAMDALLEAGDRAGVLDEFLAYTLTEPKLHLDLAQRTLPQILRGLKDKVINLVRSMLGLPKNKPMDDWMTEILGQVRELAHRPRPYYPVEHGDVRYHAEQSLRRTDARLEQVSKTFDRLLDLVPGTPTKRPHPQAAALAKHARETTEAFLNHGFQFTPAQRDLFQKIQVVFASQLSLDPALVRSLSAIHDHVLGQLTAQDLMDDRDSTSGQDLHVGQLRLYALQGRGTERSDPQGRSNLLANFVALAMVDPVLREALGRITPPKGTKPEGDLDGMIQDLAKQVIDAGASLQTGTLKSFNQRQAMDILVLRLADVAEKAAARHRALKHKGLLDRGEAWTKEKIEAGGTRLQQAADRLRQGESKAWKQGIANVLDTLAANTSETRAEAWAESLVSLLNVGQGGKTLREVARELIGTVPSAARMSQLLNISKQQVSTLRQRLREESPKQVKSWFKQPLSKQTWQRLHMSVGRVDLAAVWDLPRATLLRALVEPATLASQIRALENQLPALPDKQLWLVGANDLAHWMVHKENRSTRLLYRNAGDLASLYGSGAGVSSAEALQATPILDKLVTLRALEKLSPAYREELHTLITEQPEAMDRLVTTMQSLTQIERQKGASAMNQWKGYVPESMDPRKQVRLATPEQAKELLRTGWTKLESYQGDAQDRTPGLAYYVSSVGGEVTYNQGALQMVVNTAGGTVAGTGHTLSNVTGLVIDNPAAVERITEAKQRGLGKPGEQNLLPIFRENKETGVVEIVAYERTLKAGLVQAHTKGDTDLAVGIGIWMGRQAEEQQAQVFNATLAEALWEMWDREKTDREDEYVALNLSKDPIDQGTWEAIPPQTQRMLLDRFDGQVMVRRDTRNNMFGYRNASVRDIFTGYSGYSDQARKVMEDVAYGLLGPNAYKFLSMAEEALTSVVGASKDVIVVRSGVVAFVNLLSNQAQLLAQGVPLTELPRQFKIAKQIETYLRNEHRLARIQTEMRSVTDPAQKAKLDAEAKRVQAENERLDIYDLVKAGELPTIAEGLSETDEYTLLSDATKWLEQRTQGLPKGLTTAGRYALITRDTALYQGLNRLIQFGDLMAKQLTYEKQLRDGKTKEQALAFVQDNFVNYNILPGRTRTALEQMGLLWFWNYKLRIRKIFFRAVREHPLRALAAFMGADLSGVDSLWSSQALNAHLSYSVGYDQLARAHEMLLWNQALD